MGTTPVYQYPYPELTDPVDGPAQIKALALAVEATVKANRDAIAPLQTGEYTAVINNTTTHSQTVTFAKAFTLAPSVLANIRAASALMVSWTIRATGVGTTGFTGILTGPSAQTYSPVINWLAALTPTTPLTQVAAAAAVDGFHTVTATCHTPDCPSDGVAVPDLWIPDDPGAWGWTGVTCGACGQPIADLVAS